MNIHRQLHNLTFIIIIFFFSFFLAGFRTNKVPVGNINGMTKKKKKKTSVLQSGGHTSCYTFING